MATLCLFALSHDQRFPLFSSELNLHDSILMSTNDLPSTDLSSQADNTAPHPAVYAILPLVAFLIRAFSPVTCVSAISCKNKSWIDRAVIQMSLCRKNFDSFDRKITRLCQVELCQLLWLSEKRRLAKANVIKFNGPFF